MKLGTGSSGVNTQKNLGYIRGLSLPKHLLPLVPPPLVPPPPLSPYYVKGSVHTNINNILISPIFD